jgi:hypothetical protein
MSVAGLTGMRPRLPVRRLPTGRCRAYPRKDVRFFESFQTAGTPADPPPDRAGSLLTVPLTVPFIARVPV